MISSKQNIIREIAEVALGTLAKLPKNSILRLVPQSSSINLISFGEENKIIYSGTAENVKLVIIYIYHVISEYKECVYNDNKKQDSTFVFMYENMVTHMATITNPTTKSMDIRVLQ
jgi:hypothetical protein